MSDNEKELIAKWFIQNFRTHSDWTGTYVEYKEKCNSVKEVIDNLFRTLKNNKNGNIY